MSCDFRSVVMAGGKCLTWGAIRGSEGSEAHGRRFHTFAVSSLAFRRTHGPWLMADRA
jgi:hypothetical protein